MGLLQKLQRMASVATGNFGAMFRGIEIPPLPTATTQLIKAVSDPDLDLGHLVTVISASADVTAKVIQTVNSSLFSLQSPVLSLRHAVALLGLRHIRPLVIAHALRDGLPQPAGELFQREGYWSDCLLRAMLARAFARRHCPGEEDESFTAMLVSDVALPVLLAAWAEYYAPVVSDWKESSERLSSLERKTFGWDHAQASAWILQEWDLPVELVCYAGLHVTEINEIERLELGGTIALPVALAARAPSSLRESPSRPRTFVRDLEEHLAIEAEEIGALTVQVGRWFEEVRRLFELDPAAAARVLESIERAAEDRAA